LREGFAALVIVEIVFVVNTTYKTSKEFFFCKNRIKLKNEFGAMLSIAFVVFHLKKLKRKKIRFE
jgi:hypothetical protein